MNILKRLKIAASALLLVATSQSSLANSPSPIKLLVGFVPGGTSDAVARMLADELRVELGRNVIVENKPGAGGRIAAQALMSAPQDGTTYLFSPDSWAIFPTILVSASTLRYNYLEDMAPVARVISYPLGLYASPSIGAKDLKEYVELAKKDPALTLYASAGAGSITEFLGVVMTKEFGVKMTVVPFKGAGDVKTAVLGSQAPVGIMAPGDIFQYVADGRVVPLGFMTQKRWSVLPTVPTMKEQGFNVTQGEAFMGLWSTKKTPADERKKMEDAVRKVLSKPAFKTRVLHSNLSPDFATGDEMDKQVRSLIHFWKPVVEQSGFKP
ncbi:hypothetical protein SDC9_142111 [bioreactor metagenome]|uniref:Tripartite tricarboxylate transporter family receptor n=1 Tax=bioreactor metagenome TaxID=1076179 RepID=A0A645E321_9ZZZZ